MLDLLLDTELKGGGGQGGGGGSWGGGYSLKTK